MKVAAIALPLGQAGLVYPGLASPDGVQLLTQGGQPPFTWSLAGGTSLPAGLSLTPAGLIQGTPSAPGRSVFAVQVTDSAQAVGTALLAIVIQRATVTTDNAALSGSYAIFLRGFDDATHSPLVVLGSLSADGQGAITSGLVDIAAPTAADTAASVPVTGSYSIDAFDHRGTLTLTGNSVTRHFAIALGQFTGAVAASADGIQTDDTNGTTGQRGHLQLERQTPADFLASKITGRYAFLLGGLSGKGNGVNRQVFGGTLTADGGSWSGVGDFNRLGAGGALTDNVLSGTFGPPDPVTGRAATEITYTGSVWTGTYTGVIYLVSASRLLFTAAGPTQAGVLSGRLQLQSFGTATVDNTLVSGTVVTSVTGSGSGVDPATETSAAVSITVADAQGGLTDLVADHNSSGGVTGPCTAVSTTSTYAVDASGHVTVPAGSSTGYRAFMFSATDGFLMSLGSTPTSGFVHVQQATALSSATRLRAVLTPGASFASILSSGIANTTASASALSLTTTSITPSGVQQTGTTAIGLTTPASATGCYPDRAGAAALYVVSPKRFLLLDLNSAHTAPVIFDYQ